MTKDETGDLPAARPDAFLDDPILAATPDTVQDRVIEKLVAQSGLEPDGAPASRFREYLRTVMRRTYEDSCPPPRGYFRDTARLRCQVRLDDLRGDDDDA